jgi:competence protein ComEC
MSAQGKGIFRLAWIGGYERLIPKTMNSRSLRHRAPLLWVLLPLMAGLVAGKLQWSPLPPPWAAVAAVVLAGAALAWRRAWAPALIAGVFLSGTALYELHRMRLPDWDALPPREVRGTLEIDRVFPPRPDGRSVGGLGRVIAAEAHLAELAGQRVYFSATLRRGEESPPRSSRVEVVGVLETLPRDPAAGGFDGYLADQGVNFKLTRARLAGPAGGIGAYARFREAALRRFNEILGHGIEPHARHGGVLRAMLLGQQQELSEEQNAFFRESGTMHLFSISGLHIAVIAAAIQGVLMLMRLPQLARLVAGTFLLWLYVDITGCAPSAVRAFLMVVFVHAAHALRLPGGPVPALAASAVCVLAVRPMQLFSASFQLSYGIVAALLLLGLPLADRWTEKAALFAWLPKVSWRWYHHATDWCWRGLLGAVAIGAATTLFGLISGVAMFQLLTPVSLLANLVLIPVGSLVIVSGFLALLCGLVGLGGLAIVFNHASVLVLAGIEEAVRFFTRLPGAYRVAEFGSVWFGYAALVGLIAVILHGYAHRWAPERGGFWPPFAFTLLVLVLGARYPVTP